MPQLPSELQIQIQTTANNAGIESASAALAGLSEEAAVTSAATGASFASIMSDLGSLGSNMKSVGQTMTVGLTVPVTAGATAAAKSFMDFQQQMELAHTQAGATQQQVDGMSQSILAMAADVGQTPVALAQAFYHLASVGIEGQQALDALHAAADGAATGQANLEDVTNALVGTLNSGIGGVSGAENAMGKLNAIVGAGNMRLQDFVQSLSSGILPSAKAFGLGIDDVGAALATMTANAIPAQDAATRLRMLFSMIGAPTAAATKELKSIGLTSTQLGDDMRNHGLAFALEDLKSHLESTGLTASQQAEVIARSFGGGRESSTVITLLQNLDQLNGKYKQIQTTSGEFAQDVASEHTTAQFQFNAALAEVQKSLIELGKSIMPTLTSIMKEGLAVLKEVTAWWGSLSPAVQENVTKALLFTAVLGPLLVVAGTLITALTSIWGMFTTVAGVIGTVTGVAGGLSAALAAIPLAVTVGVALIGYEAMKQQIDGLKSDLDYLAQSQAGVANQDNQIQSAIAKARAAGNTKKVANLEKAYQLSAPSGPDLNWFQQLLTGVPHFAGGVTNFSGGTALVGENGPELVSLPKGSSVTNADRTAGMMGGTTVNVTIQGDLNVDSEERKNQLIQEIAYLMGRQGRQAVNGMI